MNKEDNEVYFLGKSKPKQHNKRIYLYTLILLAIIGISGWIYYKSTIKKTDNTEMLQTVSIHPKKTILKRPRFDKDKDITAFYSWIAFVHLRICESSKELEFYIGVSMVHQKESFQEI